MEQSSSWPASAIDADLLNTFLEISSEVVWITDYQTNKRFWLASDVNRKKYGVPPDEKITASFWLDNIHPEDYQRATQGFELALNQSSTKEYEHEYRFGNRGQYYVINDSMRFFRDEKGKVTRVVGVWHDITEKTFREDKLANLLNEIELDMQQFKIISEMSNAVMWEVDVKTECIKWKAGNRTLEEFGLNKKNYSIKDWANTIHPDDRERVLKKFNQVLNSTIEKYDDEYKFIKADKSIANVIDKGFVVRDKQGNLLRILGAMSDVTRERIQEKELMNTLDQQRKLVEEISAHEEELASSEEELRQMNEQLSTNIQILTERELIISQSQKLAKIGSWEYSFNSNTMTWSPEMYNILGVGLDFDLNDMTEMGRLLEESSLKVLSEPFMASQNKRLPFDLTVQVITPVGYRKWLRLTAYPVITHMQERYIGLAYDMTYFKESEDRLKTSEEKFSRAFHNNPDLMNIVRQEDGIVLEVNDKIEQVLGYKKEEVLGVDSKSLKLFVLDHERDSFFEEFDRNGRVTAEAVWRRKDGSFISVLLSSSLVELEGKRCILSVVRNITDRKIAEEKFQKAFDLSPDLMLIFKEKDFTLVEANRNLEEFSGYSREEVMGRPTNDFLLWEHEAERSLFLKKYFEKGQCSQEATLYKKGHIKFYSVISAQRIRLNEEDHMLTVVRDVTEKRLAEARVIESEANLNATINNTTLLVWSVDRNYNLIKFNRPFEEYIKKYYGGTLQIGRRGVAGIDERQKDLLESWQVRYKQAFEGVTLKLTETRNERTFHFSLNPIHDDGTIIGVSVFGEDITERVEKEKELAEALNKIGELKLMALRSVMNPHFIFNALNSIQFFIAQNDRKNALSYLSTFSKLVRGILTHSVNNKIKLAEELDMLRHYINLERMRFENQFDFEINISDKLDPEFIEIPSLLIQPYVENAILHGLYNKEGKGMLKITVKEGEDSVYFEIEDNGIGRKAAMELRKQNFPKHKSMGTALTEERLKLINAQDKVSFEVIDLYDQDNVPSGTKVKIGVREWT